MLREHSCTGCHEHCKKSLSIHSQRNSKLSGYSRAGSVVVQTPSFSGGAREVLGEGAGWFRIFQYQDTYC